MAQIIHHDYYSLSTGLFTISDDNQTRAAMTNYKFKNTKVFQLLFCLSITLILSACSSDEPMSEEQQVRAVIEAMELAAQERSLSGVMQHVSPKYKDAKANDFKAVQRLVQFQFIRNQNINIFSKVSELEIIDNAAAVEMSLAMTSGKLDLSDESNRLRADTFRFSLLFIKENNDWRLQSASWQQGW